MKANKNHTQHKDDHKSHHVFCVTD